MYPVEPHTELEGRVQATEAGVELLVEGTLRAVHLPLWLSTYQGRDVRITVELRGEPRLRTERGDLLAQVRKIVAARRAIGEGVAAPGGPSLGGIIQQATDFAEALAELDLDAIIRELEREPS